MKKFFLIIAPLLILIICAGTAYLYLQPPKKLLDPPPMTPQAQTTRITSHLLIRKIEELKNRAVYLQHREEGRKLVELSLGEEFSPGKQDEDEEDLKSERSEEKTGTGSGSISE